MTAHKPKLNRNERGQVGYSTLYILLSLIVASVVFTTSSAGSLAEVVQKAIISLALALIPVLIIVSSALWLFGKPADELQNTTNQ